MYTASVVPIDRAAALPPAIIQESPLFPATNLCWMRKVITTTLCYQMIKTVRLCTIPQLSLVHHGVLNEQQYEFARGEGKNFGFRSLDRAVHSLSRPSLPPTPFHIHETKRGGERSIPPEYDGRMFKLCRTYPRMALSHKVCVQR